jgi:hypothetical protein
VVQGAGGQSLRDTGVRDTSLVGQRWARVAFGFASIQATSATLQLTFHEAAGGEARPLCRWTLAPDASVTAETPVCLLR